MRFPSRSWGLLISALTLATAGCAGDSGTQRTTIATNFPVAQGAYYTSPATVETVGGKNVVPLATLDGDDNSQLTIWGIRDGSNAVTGVREASYRSNTVTDTLYARYFVSEGDTVTSRKYNTDTTADPEEITYTAAAGDQGGLASLTVTDSGTTYHVTLSPAQKDEDGNTYIIGTAYDGSGADVGAIKATLRGTSVNVLVLKNNGKAQPKTVTLPAASLAVRALAAGDPLAGLDTAFVHNTDRATIVETVLKAAGLFLDEPYSTQVKSVGNQLLLDRLEAGYEDFLASGKTLAASTDATPDTYKSDLD